MHTLAAEPGADLGTLRFEIQGVESSQGQLLVVLFERAEGFPNYPEQAFRKAIVPVHAPTTTHIFKDIPPGTYAGFAVHDEDGNGQVNTRRIIPIPKEPIGATRDAKAMFGPPKFQDAKFEVVAGDNLQTFTLVRL
jgi:uncharacterized protein (DUF2141 family)